MRLFKKAGLTSIGIWMGLLWTGVVASASSPLHVYVEDFSVEPTLIQQETSALPPEGRIGRLRERLHGPLAPETSDPQEAISQQIHAFTVALVQTLSAAGLSAERFHASPNQTQTGWLLQGTFVAAEQGHAGLQASIGFGAGAPHLEISATVSDLAAPAEGPFLLLGEQSKPSRVPGGLLTKNPYVIATKFVLAKGSTDKEVQKLAVQLADELVRYIQSHPTP